jgi:hypothetical protein
VRSWLHLPDCGLHSVGRGDDQHGVAVLVLATGVGSACAQIVKALRGKLSYAAHRLIQGLFSFNQSGATRSVFLIV